VLLGDAPDLDETGFVGEVYADAKAGPGAGWYLETAGAVLLLVAGALLALLSGSPARRDEPERTAAKDSTAEERARRRAKRRAAPSRN
jgi:hypothetical protein